MNKRKIRWDKYLLLTWKKTAIALMIWIIAVFFHNIVYAISSGVFQIKIEDPFFFSIAVILIPIYFIVSIIYTFVKRTKKRK